MHHAYLLIGGLKESLEHIPEEDKASGADVSFFEYDLLGIDDVRMLRQIATQRPVLRPYRTFILSFESITTEAQNALLRLLEDPVGAVRFYVVTRHSDTLIPTLRSRLMSIDTQPVLKEIGKSTMDFLQSSYGERLTLIGERLKEKDVGWARHLLDELEMWIQKDAKESLLEDIVFVRTYDRAAGASLKMLLEHIALSLPVVNKMR